MREVADSRAIGVDDEVAARRHREPCEQAQERRLPTAVRACDDGETATLHRDVDVAQDALAPVALLDATSADHATSTSAATNAKKTMLMTPFSVKNAASSRRRSSGLTIECS